MDLLARWVAYSYVYHGTVSTRQPVWICQVKNFQQYLYLFDGMTRRRGHLASQCCCCQWNSCHSTTWSLLPSLQNIFYIRKLPNNGTSISRMVINCHNRTIIAACTCLLLAFQLPGGFPTVSTGPIVKKAIFPSGYGLWDIYHAYSECTYGISACYCMNTNHTCLVWWEPFSALGSPFLLPRPPSSLHPPPPSGGSLLPSFYAWLYPYPPDQQSHWTISTHPPPPRPLHHSPPHLKSHREPGRTENEVPQSAGSMIIHEVSLERFHQMHTSNEKGGSTIHTTEHAQKCDIAHTVYTTVLYLRRSRGSLPPPQISTVPPQVVVRTLSKAHSSIPSGWVLYQYLYNTYMYGMCELVTHKPIA